MRKRTLLHALASIVLVAVVASGGFGAYIFFHGGPAEPSHPAEASRSEPEEATAVVYDVVHGESEAQFIIEEVLRKNPNTVVGVTNQISGSIALSFETGAVEIGEFVVNLRNLQTDDEMRDRTIRSIILQTNRDAFEFSTFVPTAVNGTPESFAPGDSLELEVPGDLTVRHVTRPVTFSMDIDISSEQEIRGVATAVILWEHFDIIVPYVGGDSPVASVKDRAELRLEFVGRDETQ